MEAQSARDRMWRYAPLIIWMAFIALASSGEFSAENTSKIIRPLLLWFFPNISEESIASVHFLTRKAAHFTEFAVLGLLSARAFAVSTRQVLRRSWFFAGVLVVVLWALLDEFHQSFVPSRTASLGDSLIDIAGGLAALIGYAYALRHSERGGKAEQ
jgi:VanZ family protein